MKVSVLIATFNSEATTRATLESVFRQTVQPDEVLVVDDGSTDTTLDILGSYKSRITLVVGRHEGVASARNTLCSHAQGEMLAFLDSDDVWHPDYLRHQLSLADKYPEAVAIFTGHIDFHGTEAFTWPVQELEEQPQAELIESRDFFVRYNSATGTFGSMSYCCLPRRMLQHLGKEPFQTNGADDFYMLNRALLWGPTVYARHPLVGYRISAGSISSDRVLNYGQRVLAFEMLQTEYAQVTDRRLSRAFACAFASHRRLFSRFLMGVGKVTEAQQQLMLALLTSTSLKSKAKSALLLCLTYLPTRLQPAWPSRQRQSPARQDGRSVSPGVGHQEAQL